MRRIDELHLDYPFAGSRMLRDLLRGEGVVIGRELVATLMRRMGKAGQGSSGAAVGMPDGGLRQSTASRTRQRWRLGTKSSRICCAGD